MYQYKWLAVVNEHAGGKKAARKWPAIHNDLLECGISIDVRMTKKAGEAVTLTSKGLQEGYTGIVAVGGDGTLNEAVNGFWHKGELINPSAVLSFVNLGTGGDFARTIKMKSDDYKGPENKKTDGPSFADTSHRQDMPEGTDVEKPCKANVSDLVKRLINGKCQTVDVGLACFQGAAVGNHYFINAANVGTGAETVRRVNADKTKFGGGHFSFLRGALAAVLTYKPNPMRIVVDGECKIEKELFAIMVCNGRFVGAGMMIAPRAEITDALFDIVVIEKMPLLKILTQFPKIYKGTHLNIKGVSYWQGSQIEISETGIAVRDKDLNHGSKQAAIVELDGEILGCCPASYSLLSQAMTLWIPA